MADEEMWKQEDLGDKAVDDMDSKPSEAVGGGSSGWGSSWGLSSLVGALKEKSTAAIEVLSHDLAEFTDTVQKEVKTVAVKVEENVGPIVQQSLGTVASPSNAGAGASGEEEKTSAGGLRSLSFFGVGIDSVGAHLQTMQKTASEMLSQARLFEADGSPAKDNKAPVDLKLEALQADYATYIVNPSEDDAFKVWQSNVDRDLQLENQHLVLASYPTVARMYGELVPNEVSSDLFWDRYFYRYQVFTDEETKRRILAPALQYEDDEDLGWDDDDDETEQPSAVSPVKEPVAEVAPSEDAHLGVVSHVVKDQYSGGSDGSWDKLDDAPPSSEISQNPEDSLAKPSLNLPPTLAAPQQPSMIKDDDNWGDEVPLSPPPNVLTLATTVSGVSNANELPPAITTAPPAAKKDGQEEDWSSWD